MHRVREGTQVPSPFKGRVQNLPWCFSECALEVLLYSLWQVCSSYSSMLFLFFISRFTVLFYRHAAVDFSQKLIFNRSKLQNLYLVHRMVEWKNCWIVLEVLSLFLSVFTFERYVHDLLSHYNHMMSFSPASWETRLPVFYQCIISIHVLFLPTPTPHPK